MSSPVSVRSPFALLLVSVALIFGANGGAAQVIVGGDSQPGFIEVRGTTSADQLIFEVTDAVKIGRGGADSVDVDFRIFDPNHSTSEETVLDFNTSQANLRLGSGSELEAGKDGDLTLEDGSGVSAIHLDGAAGDLRLGFDGGDGDLVVTNTSGNQTVTLSGNSAALTLGGSSTAGDVIVKDGAAVTNFAVDGISGDVTNAFAGEGLVKAWCRVDSDGSLLSGYRCSSSRFSAGVYFLDFTSLATDVTARPFVVSCATTNGASANVCSTVQGYNSLDDLSRIVVQTDTSSDAPFTLAVF